MKLGCAHRRPAWALTAAALAVITSALAARVGSAGAQPYEQPPALEARYLLTPAMLSGPLFRVDERVPMGGFLGWYTLRSDLGTFTVPGRDLLAIRIAELPAIQHLEATSKTSVFLDGAARAAARPVEAAANMIANPVATVEGLPGGLERLFDRVEAGAQSITQAATDSSKTTQQRAQETTARVGSVTITALGFDQVRRQLAKGLGVDPYTTNPVLGPKLTDVAWVAFSARLGVDVLVTAFVPASIAISGTSFTNDLVYDTPTADLIALNVTKMQQMGATPAQVQALRDNRWYSVTALTGIVHDLERLQGVKGRGEVIGLAGTARSEEEARFFAAAVHMLTRLQATGTSLRAVAAKGTVVATTSTGALLVPSPLDYVVWTERIARFAARPDLRAPQRSVRLSGSMSALAQREFARLGWAVYEAPPARWGSW